MQHRVGLDLALPLDFLAVIGQFSEQNQPGHFEEVTVFGELLDGVPAVKKNAFVSVDEGDRSFDSEAVFLKAGS